MRDESFWAYLKDHSRGALALFTAIFTLVLWLYNVPAEAGLYAGGLCALAGLVMLWAGWRRHLARREKRLEALENLPVWAGDLPEAEGLEAGDFRAMAEKMRASYAALADDTDRARRENLDWYTAWVHQIKIPIAVMQMTLQGEDTPEHRALETELFRVRQYAEMALTYLRLGDGASDLVIKTVRLDGVIRQAVRKYAALFVHKRLSLVYEPTEAEALTDEKWLAFILEQLLDNAVKYTPAGSVTITVTPDKILRVADTGVGIAAEDLPRVFEKGFTGCNGRADKSATGLGLYLCRLAADMLHHRLWAESEPRKGSVFCLDLHTDELMVE